MSGQKILIVDSDRRVREQFRQHLQSAGWSVLESSGGTEAVELANRHSPDVILLDLSVSKGQGETIAKQLKLDPLTCAIPIVVINPFEHSGKPPEPWADEATSPTTKLPILLAKLQHALARKKSPKPHVLVVDDEPDLVEILTALLKERGFAASGALNGAEALEVVHSVKPDAILLDLEMPRVDGWEFLYRLKVNVGLESIRVIILTGKDRSPEDRAHGLALGASDYLLKPCPPEEIIHAIRSALGDKGSSS